ncbi:MAG: ribosome silencing factor [Bdellovibrionales bacterium]|nr:ribosome silencing factor [Bdellovibrionales bacterium]
MAKNIKSENTRDHRGQETVVIEVDEVSLAKAFLSVQAAANKKAESIKVLDLRPVSSFTDYFVICSGQSDRQVQAIADSICIELEESEFKPISVEGYKDGRWIVIDYGDVVVHVFHDALRDYYDIENLWFDAKRVSIPQELYITPIQQ